MDGFAFTGRILRLIHGRDGAVGGHTLCGHDGCTSGGGCLGPTPHITGTIPLIVPLIGITAFLVSNRSRFPRALFGPLPLIRRAPTPRGRLHPSPLVSAYLVTATPVNRCSPSVTTSAGFPGDTRRRGGSRDFGLRLWAPFVVLPPRPIASGTHVSVGREREKLWVMARG